jgi:membrane protease YdiL (CAAX protease family)
VEPEADNPQPPENSAPASVPPTPDPAPEIDPSGIPLQELEVVPPQQSGADLLRISFQRWLIRNLTPLFVIFLSAVLIVLPSMLAPITHAPPEPVKSPIVAPTLPVPDKEAPETPKITRSILLMELLMFGGAFVCLCGLIASAISLEARQWIVELLGTRTRRPLPALRALDVVAIVLVMMASGQMLSAVLVFAPEIPVGSRRVILALLSEIPFLLCVAAAVYLARTRAGGLHGSWGLWPFWKLPPRATYRGIAHDVGVGVLTYALTMWLVVLSIYLSFVISESLGYKKQEHPIIEELTSSKSIWVTMGYIFVATIGAAFFEELLFRGVLYNALRRYFGPIVGAIFSSAVFAAVHPPGSPYLALFTLAMILTWLYDRTGRLVSSMTLHATNNLLTLILTLSQAQ